MRILITGGAGFIGQHTARLLAGAGHELVALDSLHPQVHLDPEGAVAAFPGPVIRGDVADAGAWHGLPAVDAVIHLAAETGTGQSMYEPERYESVNVGGTDLAARFAAGRGIPLVALSSRAVYGEGRARCPEHGVTMGARCCERAVPEASTEDDEHRPVSVYGRTKSAAEGVVRAAAREGLACAVIRPQNVIGPGQALHNPYTGVLAAFCAFLREGRPLTVYGDGSQTRDVVHVADLARIIAWSLDRIATDSIATDRIATDRPAAGPEPLVVNAGTGRRVTLLDLARWAGEGSPDGPTGIAFADVHRAGDIQDACADMSRLEHLGGPLPRIAPRDAVTDFIRWSWDRPGAAAQAWDDALEELERRLNRPERDVRTDSSEPPDTEVTRR